MKNSNIKPLILIFILSLQLSLIVWFYAIPNKDYFSVYNIKNFLEYTSTNLGGIFPDFNVYSNKSNFNIRSIISKYDKSILIIDNCGCKRDLINAWLEKSINDNIHIIYIYTDIDVYKKSILQNKYNDINIFVCSFMDIKYFFNENEIKDLPAAFIVNKEGVIVEKRK